MITFIYNRIPWLRLRMYRLMLKYVKYHRKNYLGAAYLCWYKSYSGKTLMPCWKNLKEVKQNSNSESIVDYHRGNLNCREPMFYGNGFRIEFLLECIEILLKENPDLS